MIVSTKVVNHLVRHSGEGRNPLLLKLVPDSRDLQGIRRDDVWTPAFAGVTIIIYFTGSSGIVNNQRR